MARAERRGFGISLALLLPLAGCRLQDDLIAVAVGDSGGGAGGTGGRLNPSGGGAAGSLSGGVSSAETGGKNSDGGSVAQGGSVATCPADRPAISVPLADGTRRNRCSSWAARRSFGQAICSCNDLRVTGALTTTSIDSSQADMTVRRSAAAVSVNGRYQGSDYVRVGGSLTIAGSAPLNSSGGLDISGDLRLAADTSAAGPIAVGRDAWLLGDTSSLSLATIGRDLHLAPGAMLRAFGPVVVAGTRVEDSFAIAPPCPCGADQTLDVTGIVADALSDNDNAVLGLDLDALADVGAPAEVTLRCGRFALNRISGRARISLRVSGRVALMVAGDVQIPPGFTLTLERQAELDWFISGNLALSPDARIGDSARAAAVRVYVLGSEDIDLPGTEVIAMNLYAPDAGVTIAGLGDVYGALFANSITAPAALVAHYDRALLRADTACSLEIPPSCSTCDQCSATSTCSGGTCAACASDSDCCFPLTCTQGECRGLLAN